MCPFDSITGNISGEYDNEHIYESLLQEYLMT